MLFTASPDTAVAQSQADAGKAQALFNAGNTLIAKSDFAGAITNFTEAISILPEWHLPYLNRGVAYVSLLKLTEAEADAVKALSLIRPETPSGEQHAGLAHQIKGMVKQHQGNLNAAIIEFSLAAERAPSNSNIHNNLGAIFLQLGRNDEALTAFSKAIELDPKLAMPYINRATVNERLNNGAAALSDLDKAINLDKNSGNAYYTRGTIRMRSKAFPEALTDLNEAIRLNSEKSIYFHARGLLHHQMKKFDLAIADHTKAIVLDPNNSRAYSDRAIAHYASGVIKSAIDDMKAAVSLDSRSSVLKYNLSYFLYQSGKYSEAVNAATQCISQSPTWRSPYMVRSNAYIKLGMSAKAKADRVKAAGLDPNEKPANDNYLVFDLKVLNPEEVEQQQ